MADSVLRRVQTDSRELNSIQDQLASTVNPALRLVSQGAQARQTFAALPVAAEAQVGLFVMVQADRSSPTSVYVCLRNSAGGFEWVGVALSS